MNQFLLSACVLTSVNAFWAGSAQAAIMAKFDLNGIYDGFYDSGTQYQTGNFIKYQASLTGWTHSGFNAIHALQIGANNWALMVYSSSNPNTYTLQSGFSANTLGVTYWVSYDIAPTVYVNSGQATREQDILRISVLNSAGAAVATNDAKTGAWAGSQDFHQEYFSYVGDGIGDARLQITSGNPGSGFFAGAVDNIAFESTQPVPEPTSAVLLVVGTAGAVLRRRRTVNRCQPA